MMRMRRIFAISKKEVFHILRDPFTLAMALLMPVLMVTIFGFAIEFNIRNIPVAVFDGDRSFSSRTFLETLSSSGFFILENVSSPLSASKRVNSEQARVALIIPGKFEQDLLSGRGAQAQVLLDGTDSTSVGPTISYLQAIQYLAAEKITGQSFTPPLEIKTRFLYNGELNSRWFTVPGLLVVILGILSILLTALTVAREWENGSMELLLSTPVRPLELIIGKLAPYVGLGLAAVTMVYLIARGWMGVPFRGSHLLFLYACLTYLASYLAIGLLISVITRKQQLAMLISMILGLLPSVLLSGFLFPIESMPRFFRIITFILPARWFTNVSRDLFLKGPGFFDMPFPYIILTGLSVLVILIALLKFKTDLEP